MSPQGLLWYADGTGEAFIMVLQLNLNLTDTCVSYVEELLEKFLKILASCTQAMNTHITLYAVYA